jgi:regulatory protein
MSSFSRHAYNRDEPDETSKTLDGPTLRERALRLLARRDYPRAELIRKLGPHTLPAEALTELLDDLVRLGLLSDERYAEQRSNARGKRLGNSRLAHELRTKGVEDAIIASALDTLGDEMARAKEVWRRKFRDTPPGNREEWAKQARFLQSRGFPPNIIRQILDDPEHVRPNSSDD